MRQYGVDSTIAMTPGALSFKTTIKTVFAVLMMQKEQFERYRAKIQSLQFQLSRRRQRLSS